jgi:predicted CXXCH cytochrome family protein
MKEALMPAEAGAPEMSMRIIASIVCMTMVLVVSGCKTATRYKVLSFFFDGVPSPREKPVAQQPGAAPARIPAPGISEHGPYASRMCDACHQRQTNDLVAPEDELCYRCHDLNLNKKYVHGPLASGGCLVCHDPHSSPNRFLLVSESTNFCLTCHDVTSVAANPAHVDTSLQCTDCHSAHMSDNPHLLK